MNNPSIIIFDGVCNLCNAAVRFIINRDPQGKFAFTPMQGTLADELIAKHGIPNVGEDTLLLIKDNQYFVYSDAVLEIAKDLTGWWYLINLLKFIPKPIRDYVYQLIARNRYRLFGQRATCMVPSQDVRKRFLDTDD
jgi:predicted DCC family thiol-disulfide oxidoreductase YuxK